MKFKFPYEKLRFHRQLEEDLAKKAFLEAKHQVDQANADLKKIYEDMESARERTLQLSRSGKSSGMDLTTSDEFISLSGIRIDKKRAELRELLQVMEEKQNILVQATIDRKTLDKLKERKLEEFRKLKKKSELKFLDEITTTRFKQGEWE